MRILPRLHPWMVLVAVLAPSQAGDLAYRKEGHGGVVVLLHDLGGSKGVWNGYIDRQKRNFTCVAVDLPGHGSSAAPNLAEGRVDLRGVAQDLAAQLRKLKTGPALVVGHGLGGLVGAYLAQVDPALVRGLLLVDGGLGPLAPEVADRLEQGLAQDAAGTLKAHLGAQSASPAQAAALFKEAKGVPPQVLAAYVRGWRASGLPAAAVKVPVQLFASAKFIPDPNQEAAALQRLGLVGLRRFQVQYLVNSSHWMMEDEAIAFDLLLNEFDTATLSGE